MKRATLGPLRPREQELARLFPFLRWVIALGAFFTSLSTAHAYTPPAHDGYVTDQAGKLSRSERENLNTKLASIERSTGLQVVVFLPASLEGETIEDVAYTTARAWQVGQKGLDNGVLLVIAPRERKVRIETGKGAGGDLTDLQTQDIQRERINPRLREGRFYEGISAGIDGIVEALGKGDATTPRRTTRPPGRDVSLFVIMFIVVGIVIFVAILSRLARRQRGRRGGGDDDDPRGGGGFFIFPPFGGGGGDGGSWGGGGDGGSWGGGGSDGGGFSGGGGDFGGGGSSSDY